MGGKHQIQANKPGEYVQTELLVSTFGGKIQHIVQICEIIFYEGANYFTQ